MISKLKVMDLHTWATDLEARHILPRILRQLILLKAGVQELEFPSDEETQLGGYDGTLSFTGDSPYIPTGRSVWEFGVNGAVKTKADKDYKKRTFPTKKEKQSIVGPDGVPVTKEREVPVEPDINLAEHTFVFVTLRKWNPKKGWIEEKLKDKKWKDVRVIDATDLATWLETAPSVHSWLLAMVGKLPPDYLHLECFWEEFSAATLPATSHGLLLAGRDAEKIQMLNALHKPPKLVSLQAESREAALAFVAAAVLNLPEKERDGLLGRCVVVTNAAVFRTLVKEKDPLILFPYFADPLGLAAAAGKHHVVAVLGPDDRSPKEVLNLPRADMISLYDALNEMKVPETRTWTLALLGRRNLLALRRKLAVSPEVSTPPWAVPGQTFKPVQVLLAGGWEDDHEPDQKLLEELSGLPYQDLQDRVTEASHQSDPPFRRTGRVWLVSAPDDVWDHLGSRFTPHHLKTFEAMAIKMLTSLHPQDEQGNPPTSGVTMPYSTEFLTRVLETLVLMAIHNDDDDTHHLKLSDVVDRIVREALGPKANWQAWQALSHNLDQLAEAAPEAFLGAAALHLADGMEDFKALFQDKVRGKMADYPHPYLLKALEIIAWTPRLLENVVKVLVRLHELDQPPGELTNRPKASLIKILDAFRPATTASVELRLRALDRIRTLHPQLGWEITSALLPKGLLYWERPNHPNRRNDMPDTFPQASEDGFHRFVGGLVERLFREASQDPEKYVFLVESVPFLSPMDRSRLLDALDQENLRLFSVSLKQKLLEKFRWLERDQNFGRAVVFDDAQLTQSAVVQFKLLPEDLVDRHAWMFGNAPCFPGMDPGNWRDYFSDMNQAQRQALGWLASQMGVEGIRRLWSQTRHTLIPDVLAKELTQLPADPENAFLANHLDGTDELLNFAAQKLVVKRYDQGGQAWFEEKVLHLLPRLGISQQVLFLYLLPPSGAVWDVAEALGPAVVQGYWDRIEPFNLPNEVRERAVRQLIGRLRVYAAMHVMAAQGRENRLPRATLMDLLELVPPRPWVNEINLKQAFDVNLSQVLDDVFEDQSISAIRKVQVELKFYEFFSHHVPAPGLTHQWMAMNPGIFNQVLCLVHPSENTEQADDHQAPKTARELLNSWRVVPGYLAADQFDADVFRNWFAEALTLAVENHREAAFMVEAARLFKRTPKGMDGSWPHPVVRDLIETWERPELEDILFWVFSSDQGVYFKNINDPGELERDQAEKFRQYAALAVDHPKTAGVLHKLAKALQEASVDESNRASLRQDLGGW